MNNDRMLREAQEHAETLVEDRGFANALAWANHCATRSTDGFWSRVVLAIEAMRCADCGTLNFPDEKRCRNCGMPFEEQRP